MTHQLVIDDVRLAFGGVVALAGVSLGVAGGEIAAIIGPNGAGKTSLLNAISGLYQPQTGRIDFEGTSLLGCKPHQIARLGIARTFRTWGCSRA
jgi:branched-chain amino acid transport system ATP-binding protein